MKNKLLFSAAALVVAFGASSLSARSLNTFDESDRVSIGAYSDRVNAVVESLGLSSAATSKSTPLKAEAAATADATLILSALGNADVAKFVAKELGLKAETSAAELSVALTTKLSDKTFNASAFARSFADLVATTAVKVEPLRVALDGKVTALATAKAAAKLSDKGKTVVAVVKAEDEPVVVVAKPVAKPAAAPIIDVATLVPSDTAAAVASYDALDADAKAKSTAAALAILADLDGAAEEPAGGAKPAKKPETKPAGKPAVEPDSYDALDADAKARSEAAALAELADL